MTKGFNKLIRPVALTLFLAGVGTFAVAPFFAEPAFAKGSNGNSGDKGKSGDKGNSGGNKSNASSQKRGSTASALKGLNAAHANANAFANAGENSRVGQIAVYKNQSLATLESEAALTAAQGELDALLATTDGRTSLEVQSDIDGLDPASLTFAEDLANLTAELDASLAVESQIDTLANAVGAAQTIYDEAVTSEETALLDATDGRTLSNDALNAFREMLGL